MSTLRGLIAAALVAAMPVDAGVFKWVDEDGRTHYGDRPPPEATRSESVRVKPSGGPATDAPDDARRRINQQRLLDAFARERAEREARHREQAQARSERRQRCAQARDRLRSISEAGYLYRIGEDGERRVYSDEERDQATRHARAAVRRWCG